MTIARSIAQQAARGVSRAVADTIKAASLWTPASLSSLLQRFLDTSPSYSASTVSSYPVLTPEESGTLATPRAGRCFLFDGTNDYGTLGARLTSGSVAALTVLAIVKVSSITGTAQVIASEQNTDASNQKSWSFYIQGTTGKLYLATSGNGSAGVDAYTDSNVTAGVWVQIAFTYSSGVVQFYINGSPVSSTYTGVSSALFSTNGHFGVGAQNVQAVPNCYFGGSIRDVRIYNVAKSAAEIAAIYNQASTPKVVDRTGLLAAWWCEDESGTTAYDWSGNGKHLTLNNITQSTFHAADTGVTYSAANELGHTLSGSVVVPRNEADITKDAAGNSLGFAGPLKLPATVEVPCITGNGSTVYVDLGSALFPATADFNSSFWYYHTASAYKVLVEQRPSGSGSNAIVLFQNGSPNGLLLDVSGTQVGGITSLVAGTWYLVTFTRSGTTWTVTAGGQSISITKSESIAQQNTWLLAANGFAGYFSDARISSLSVTTGGVTKRFPLQEGPGADNTNRNLYWVASDGTSGTVSGAIVGGVVSTIWANRCPYAQDHCINYGGRLTSQNLLTYSEQFDNGIWSKPNVTVAANATASPDGTVTADSITPNTSTISHHISSTNVVSGTGTVYANSVYAKANGYNFAGLSDGVTGQAVFNLQTGSVVSQDAGITAITPVDAGNGWWRLGISYTASSSRGLGVDVWSGSSKTLFAGDGASGIFIWGAQINAGSTPSSYQPTASAAVPANTFVAGRLTGSLAADGLAKTLTAGKHRNPGSRVVPNVWSAPSLARIGYTSSIKLAPADDVQSISPADTKFRRTSSTGDDRYIASQTALTGSDKTNAQTYVS